GRHDDGSPLNPWDLLINDLIAGENQGEDFEWQHSVSDSVTKCGFTVARDRITFFNRQEFSVSIKSVAFRSAFLAVMTQLRDFLYRLKRAIRRIVETIPAAARCIEPENYHTDPEYESN